MTERIANLQTAANDRSSMEELSGDREQFLRFVERRMPDRASAEDLLQLAYARAMVQADSLRDSSAARAWFYRILRNAIVDFYRHRSVEDRIVHPMADGFDIPAKEEGSPTLCGCMDRAVDDLKPEYASVLREVELADGEGGSIKDYAHRAGITSGNAAVRALRARKALRDRLQKICGSCAGAGCLDCVCSQPSVTD